MVTGKEKIEDSRENIEIEKSPRKHNEPPQEAEEKEPYICQLNHHPFNLREEADAKNAKNGYLCNMSCVS